MGTQRVNSRRHFRCLDVWIKKGLGTRAPSPAHILLPGPSAPEANLTCLTFVPGTFYSSGCERRERSLWAPISTKHWARIEFFPKVLSFHPHARQEFPSHFYRRRNKVRPLEVKSTEAETATSSPTSSPLLPEQCFSNPNAHQNHPEGY